MVDSGATTKFLSRRFIERNRVTTRRLAKPIPLYNIDGTENHDGMITAVAVLDMAIGVGCSGPQDVTMACVKLCKVYIAGN